MAMTPTTPPKSYLLWLAAAGVPVRRWEGEADGMHDAIQRAEIAHQGFRVVNGHELS